MLTDSSTVVLDRILGDDIEPTAQHHRTPWHWPLTDPDNALLDEAHAALRCTDEPTLPILEAVLEGLRHLERQCHPSGTPASCAPQAGQHGTHAPRPCSSPRR